MLFQTHVAKDFTDLHAWQLAEAVRLRIVELTGPGSRAWNDVRFRSQIQESSSSATANIAEGFGRFRHKEFAHFLHIACGSLRETQNHILKGRRSGYFSETDAEHMIKTVRRSFGATVRLMKYLESTPDPK